MSRFCALILFGLLLFCGQRVTAAQSLPKFCEAVDPALLNGLEAPYSRHVAPDGTSYCEGLLPKSIGILPPEVISVKQDQAPVSFVPGTNAVLTWHSSLPAGESAHLKLRALKDPLFALDAEIPSTKFEWNSNLIARLQPKWENMAALLTRQISVSGKESEVVVPVRQGPGCSNSYTFLLRSFSPIHLTTALVEPIDGKSPFSISICTKSGPVPNTFETTIPFSHRPQGVFRLSLGEDIHRAGAVAKVYLLISGCAR